MKDPIINEVRRIRKDIELEHNNDWEAIVKHFQSKPLNDKHKHISYEPKKLPGRGVA